LDNAIYSNFVRAVARGRNVSDGTVRGGLGRAVFLDPAKPPSSEL
jgi:hypothetical protein